MKVKYLKMFGPAAVAAVALTAFLGASSATAQTIYKYTTPSANDPIAIGTEVIATLEPGTSTIFKETFSGFTDTCTGSEIKLGIATNTTTDAGGSIHLTFTGCSHTTHVLTNGEIEFKNIAGTTNGTATLKGTRVTVNSTIFGLSCTANFGAGTAIGTFTGAKLSTARATIDVNAVITLENGCGDATWTGSYLVTSPVGLTYDS